MCQFVDSLIKNQRVNIQTSHGVTCDLNHMGLLIILTNSFWYLFHFYSFQWILFASKENHEKINKLNQVYPHRFRELTVFLDKIQYQNEFQCVPYALHILTSNWNQISSMSTKVGQSVISTCESHILFLFSHTLHVIMQQK